MTRVRMIALTMFGLALIPLVGGVFGTFIFVALLPFVVVASLGLATSDRSIRIAAVAMASGLIISTVAATVLAGGRSPEEFLFAFGPAVPRLFTTSWPSPQRPELVGLTSMLAALALGVSQLLARVASRRLIALLPCVAVAVFLTVAGAAAGPHVAVWCWFLMIGVAYLVLSTRGAALRAPDPQAVVVAALAVTIVGAVGVVLPAGGRFEPRRSNLDELNAYVPPIEEYANLNSIDPPQSLFEIGGDVEGLERFRTTVYDVYDGSQFGVGFQLEEIGTVVRNDLDADHEFTVWPLDSRLRFVPFAGEPVAVGAQIASNRERDVVALLDDDVTAKAITVKTSVGADDGALAATEFVPTSMSGPFATAAEDVVGDTDGLESRLDLLEETMKNDWKLNPPDRPSPLQSKLLEDFVSQNQRGGVTQFVAAFVLMAQTLGADARMVGGYVVENPALPGADLVIDTSNARLWAEVRTESGGWRAYDPVPETPDADDESNTVPIPVPRTAAATPPAQAPAPIDKPVETEPEKPDTPATGWPTWAVGSIATAIGLVVAVLSILVFKRVRRWYWMNVGDPSKRIRGAWAEATSTLIDAGLRVGDSWTDLDIVRRSGTIDGVAVDDVAYLAQAARTVNFAPHPPPVSTKDLAAGRASVRSVRRGIQSCRNWRGRARMRFSVRSVWPTTRTPVIRRARRHRHRSGRKA